MKPDQINSGKKTPASDEVQLDKALDGVATDQTRIIPGAYDLRTLLASGDMTTGSEADILLLVHADEARLRDADPPGRALAIEGRNETGGILTG